jgi:hypothetical protein
MIHLPLIFGAFVGLYFVNKFMPSKTAKAAPSKNDAAPPTVLTNNSGKSYSDARFEAPPRNTEVVLHDQENNPPSPLSAGSLVYQDNNNASTINAPVLADEFGGNISIAVPLIDG